MNIQKALQQANHFLKEKNITTSDLDTQILMSEAIKKKKEFIIFNLDKKITDSNLKYFAELIKQRAKCKPIAYLIKKKSFWKYEFI